MQELVHMAWMDGCMDDPARHFCADARGSVHMYMC